MKLAFSLNRNNLYVYQDHVTLPLGYVEVARSLPTGEAPKEGFIYWMRGYHPDHDGLRSSFVKLVDGQFRNQCSRQKDQSVYADAQPFEFPHYKPQNYRELPPNLQNAITTIPEASHLIIPLIRGCGMPVPPPEIILTTATQWIGWLLSQEAVVYPIVLSLFRKVIDRRIELFDTVPNRPATIVDPGLMPTQPAAEPTQAQYVSAIRVLRGCRYGAYDGEILIPLRVIQQGHTAIRNFITNYVSNLSDDDFDWGGWDDTDDEATNEVANYGDLDDLIERSLGLGNHDDEDDVDDDDEED